MRTATHFASVGILASAAALACGPLQASEAWAPTHTYKYDVGSAVASRALQPGETVHVVVALRLHNESDLDALVARRLSGEASQPLGRGEFMTRFAPTDADVQSVIQHLSAAGFTHIHVAGNHLLVSADGSAAGVKAAFNTDLRHFTVGGREVYANLGDAQVPAHLAGIVSAVHGLQNVTRAHTMIKVAGAGTNASGTAVGHDPVQFPAIYDASALPVATGASIGIIGEGDLSGVSPDLALFVSQNNLAMPTVNYINAGTQGTDTSGLDEWDLDSQSSLSAAGGGIEKINFYIATDFSNASLTEAYNAAVEDNAVQSVNVSLGGCETGYVSDGSETTDDAIFKTGIAQGQVFSVSSGDSGSYECGHKTGGQSWPAVSPYVMAIGGTTLKTVNTTTYASESVWSCTSALTCNRLVGGGAGGGVSSTEAAPTWQVQSGVLGTSTQRGVPDISFDADPNSGALVVYKGGSLQVGGTSLSAPLFSGFWARIQSLNSNALKFPAPAIYKYGVIAADAKKMFHDVTTGQNGGYSAGPGWDYASGFGSLDIGKFSAFISTHSGF